MRRLIITIIAVTLAISAQAQDYKSLYQKYSDDERVTAIYISPAMFKMIGKLPEVKIEGEGVDFAPMIKAMTGFYMLETEDSSLAEKISKDVKKVVGGQKFETLMEIKDKGQKVNVFSLGDDDFLKSVLLTVFNGDGDTVFIGIDGLMRRTDVEAAVSGAARELF